MANSNSKAAVLLNIILMVSLLLFINMAESRFFGIGFEKRKLESSSPVCEKVYGQREGDTCFSISQAFNLTLDSFIQINPNLDCDKIFVGEWLCIDGHLS